MKNIKLNLTQLFELDVRRSKKIKSAQQPMCPFLSKLIPKLHATTVTN